MENEKSKFKIKLVIVKFLFFVSTLVAVYLFWKNNWLTFAILLLLAIIFLIILKDVASVYYYIIIAACGTVSEIICVYAGAWKYKLPQFLGIPFWLPLVWGMAGLCFKDAYQFIKKSKK